MRKIYFQSKGTPPANEITSGKITFRNFAFPSPKISSLVSQSHKINSFLALFLSQWLSSSDHPSIPHLVKFPSLRGLLWLWTHRRSPKRNQAAARNHRNAKRTQAFEWSEGGSTILATANVVTRWTKKHLSLSDYAIIDSSYVSSFLQCRQKTMDFVASCKAVKNNKQCKLNFCHTCLLNRFAFYFFLFFFSFFF